MKNYTDVPAGGTKKAALADAIRRLGRGDTAGALEVYRTVQIDEDPLVADARRWCEWYFRAAPTRSGEFVGVDSVMGAARIVERAVNERKASGSREEKLSARDMVFVLSGGVPGRAVGGWNERGGASLDFRPHWSNETRAFQGAGDFVGFLTDTLGKLTLDAIPEAAGVAMEISAERELDDVREKQISIYTGADEMEERTAEGREYTIGRMYDSKVSAQIPTYGRNYKISEEAILESRNTLGMRDWPAAFAREFGRRTADAVIGALVDSTLFTAANKNVAGTGTSITENALQAGWTAIAKQEAAGGGPQGFRPEWLLTGEGDRLTAEKRVLAVSSGDAPILSVYSDPRVTAGWFLGAGRQWPGLLRLVLPEAKRLPLVRVRSCFEVDGIEIAIRHSIAGAHVLPGAFYKNGGA